MKLHSCVTTRAFLEDSMTLNTKQEKWNLMLQEGKIPPPPLFQAVTVLPLDFENSSPLAPLMAAPESFGLSPHSAC